MDTRGVGGAHGQGRWFQWEQPGNLVLEVSQRLLRATLLLELCSGRSHGGHCSLVSSSVRGRVKVYCGQSGGAEGDPKGLIASAPSGFFLETAAGRTDLRLHSLTCSLRRSSLPRATPAPRGTCAPRAGSRVPAVIAPEGLLRALSTSHHHCLH